MTVRRLRLPAVWPALLIATMFGQSMMTYGKSELPPAIYQDPPVDVKYPASGAGVRFSSRGKLVNAQLYRPAGSGPHPTVILLHGLPGNEQNLDLARAIQRSGWTVITFHYRGSWGSPGAFTLRGGVDDAEAIFTLLQDPVHAKAWGVDPRRIVLAGHSYGGYIAARTASAHPKVLGIALIAPWDISYDGRALVALSEKQREATGTADFDDDVVGRLSGATATSLTSELVEQGPAPDLTAFAAPLARTRLLIVTATLDDPDDQAIGILAKLRQLRATQLESRTLTTDHAFNDQRIALEILVLKWLARLPGAPLPHR